MERKEEHPGQASQSEAGIPGQEPGAARPVNRTALGLVLSAAALTIGSLTPWLTIFGFGLSGVSIHYGIVSLITAGLVGVLAYLTTRSVSAKALRGSALAAMAGGLLSVASAVYVGWAIRNSYADEEGATDEFSLSLAEAFRPSVGIGLWLVLLAGIAAVVLTLPFVLQRRLQSRLVLGSLLVLAVLGIGGFVAADQKAQSDRQQDIAQAQARAEAEQERERAAELAAQRAEAEAAAAAQRAEAEAAAAEATDRQRFNVMLTACTKDEFFGHTARGTIRNASSEPRTYEVSVVFENGAGQQVETGIDYISELPSGKVGAWEVSGFDSNIASCQPPEVEVSQY